MLKVLQTIELKFHKGIEKNNFVLYCALKPNFMKSNLHLPLLFGTFLLAFLFGCGSDTEVNFLLNEREFNSVDATPVEQIDSIAFYEIYAGDTVVFKDVSEPLKEDRKRYWNLDGQEGWDTIDNRLTMHVYENLGKVKVVLCVDNEDNCTAKAILVKERPYVPEVEYTPQVVEQSVNTPTPKLPKQPVIRKPELRFILPNWYSSNTTVDEFTISVSAKNVTKNDITLLVNGQVFNKFNLSKKGLLTSKIPLKEGRNIVILSAENSGGSVKEEKEFIYSHGGSGTPSVGFTQPTTSSATTSSDKYDIVVATANIAKKDLTLTVGGQAIKDFSFFANTGELKARVSLKKGENRIRVAAGSVSTEVTVTLDNLCSGVMFTGVQSKEISLGSCNDFSVSNGSITLVPSRNIRLMGAVVYSSECGSITLKLENVSETLELSENKNQLTFNKLDGVELEAGNSYTLTYSTGKSSDCPKGAPTLLNATACDKNSSGNQCLTINYNGKASLFSLKYQ